MKKSLALQTLHRFKSAVIRFIFLAAPFVSRRTVVQSPSRPIFPRSSGPLVLWSVFTLWSCCPAVRWSCCAAADSKQVPPELAAKEKEGCTKNLQTIYTAIEAYRRDHKNLPNWFSDLVPDYLPDVNVLICPVCRRTGETDVAPLSDPRIASSYLFEFCPVPLGNAAPGNPKVTRREWKQRQMGGVGSIVPIVRCRHQPSTLNLAFDGRVYESPPSWEAMLTNVVDPESITPARMFPTNETTGKSTASKKTYPPREPNAAAQLLDLTRFYNANLTDTRSEEHTSELQSR